MAFDPTYEEVEALRRKGMPSFGYAQASIASDNNGGSTDYYKLKPEWKDGMDIIEDRKMNYAQGNILKVAMTFNVGRHDGTTYERELNKIIFFAQRELDRL